MGDKTEIFPTATNILTSTLFTGTYNSNLSNKIFRPAADAVAGSINQPIQLFGAFAPTQSWALMKPTHTSVTKLSLQNSQRPIFAVSPEPIKPVNTFGFDKNSDDFRRKIMKDVPKTFTSIPRFGTNSRATQLQQIKLLNKKNGPKIYVNIIIITINLLKQF